MKLSFRYQLIFSFALVSLLAGVLNYLLFQPDIILLKMTEGPATPYEIKNNFIRYFFTGYFSDIAWCISLCCIAFALAELNYIRPSGKILLLLLPFIAEGLQYAGFINGTFDLYDVLAYIIIITFFVLLFPAFKTMVMEKGSQLFPVVIVATVFFVIALACASTKQVVADKKYNGIFKISPEKDEVVKNINKLEFVKNTTNPTIVLRVPNATREVLEEDKNVKTLKNNDGTNNLNDINVYNVIEKELLKGGFTVRDRALFEKVLGDKSVSDYSRIKELTETDLMLELSNIQYVKYPMNYFTFFSQSKRQGSIEHRITCPNYFNLYGLRLEFRLIKVKENDFIGSFTYNYAPCDDSPCNYYINVTADNSCSTPYLEQGTVVISETRLIQQSEIERFVKSSAQKLVKEMFVNK